MSTLSETSDGQLVDLLRQKETASIADIARATSVTATAVRQRLSRLMAQGLVAREIARAGRGRPGHRYSLTEAGRRQAGTNFSDLAVVLWDEIRQVKDDEVRRGLLERIAETMARMYREQIVGSTLSERMEALKALFAERRVPLELDHRGALPVLTVKECPYPELAEKDRGICAVERMLFAKLVEQPMRLSQCRLDGHDCCRFETN
jgi:predicted ArsR family transcriptional regulator